MQGLSQKLGSRDSRARGGVLPPNKNRAIPKPGESAPVRGLRTPCQRMRTPVHVNESSVRGSEASCQGRALSSSPSSRLGTGAGDHGPPWSTQVWRPQRVGMGSAPPGGGGPREREFAVEGEALTHILHPRIQPGTPFAGPAAEKTPERACCTGRRSHCMGRARTGKGLGYLHKEFDHRRLPSFPE